MKKRGLRKIQGAIFAKSEGINALVVTAILIVIAVALVIIFKDYIADLLDNIFTKVNGKVDEQLQ